MERKEEPQISEQTIHPNQEGLWRKLPKRFRSFEFLLYILEEEEVIAIFETHPSTLPIPKRPLAPRSTVISRNTPSLGNTLCGRSEPEPQKGNHSHSNGKYLN